MAPCHLRGAARRRRWARTGWVTSPSWRTMTGSAGTRTCTSHWPRCRATPWKPVRPPATEALADADGRIRYAKMRDHGARAAGGLRNRAHRFAGWFDGGDKPAQPRRGGGEGVGLIFLKWATAVVYNICPRPRQTCQPDQPFTSRYAGPGQLKRRVSCFAAVVSGDQASRICSARPALARAIGFAAFLRSSGWPGRLGAGCGS